MKKLVLAFGLLLMMFPFINAQENQAAKDTAEITFEKKVIDLGTIKPGPISMEYVFTNTGKGILQLNNVSPSCGCTIANFPKEPIKPGEKGVIKATFNGGSLGHVSKNITVVSNSKTPVITLSFNANVANPAETVNTQQQPTETKK
jgi:hypothetical protein